MSVDRIMFTAFKPNDSGILCLLQRASKLLALNSECHPRA